MKNEILLLICDCLIVAGMYIYLAMYLKSAQREFKWQDTLILLSLGVLSIVFICDGLLGNGLLSLITISMGMGCLVILLTVPGPFIRFFTGYDRTICGMIGACMICFIALFQRIDKMNTLPTWAAVSVYIISFLLAIPLFRLYSSDFHEYRVKRNAETDDLSTS